MILYAEGMRNDQIAARLDTRRVGLALVWPATEGLGGRLPGSMYAQDLFDDMYVSLVDCSSRQLLKRPGVPGRPSGRLI